MIRDLDALTSRRFDVLVIGGGICGLMAAWDAATRGLHVALVDRHDLGSGASFHHHRTLHGGLRYLQKLDLGRLRESARERRAWARMAPQFIEPQAFAIQAGGARGKSPGLMQAAFTADAVLTADRNRGLDSSLHLPRGKVVGSEERASLDTGGLLPDGPIAVWHDYRTAHAERLTFAVARAAAEAGAVLANYMDVVELLRQYFVAKTFTAVCSGNRFTAQAIAPLYTLSRRFYFMHHKELNDLPEVARLHAELLRAIASGDEQAAAVACDLQIDYAASFAKRIITSGF